MVFETYVREYKCDAADGQYGFQIGNGDFALEGRVDLPGFRFSDMAPGKVDFLFELMKIEFEQYDPTNPAHHCVARGLRRLLLGEPSNWKATHLCIQPGKLRFYLQNSKSRIAVEFYIPEDVVFVRFNLSLKRKDLKGEIDFFNLVVGHDYVRIKETHRRSHAKRRTELRFSDRLGEDEKDMPVMIGVVEEFR